MWFIVNFLFTWIHLLSCHEVLVAYNCGSQTNVSTKYVKYTSDEMYQGLTSKMALKSNVPSSITDQQDKKLLISQRVSDFDAFSYYFKITSRDHYLLIFKFIEVVHKNKDQRSFNIKIGDQIVHKVDIFGQAGYGNVLHKWMTFDLKEDVIYLNKTYPALNAYIYTKRLLKVTFQKIKGIPKIDALILVKGDDCQKFLNDYISYEQSKNLIVRQYVSEKYHILPQNKFPSIKNRLDFVIPQEGNFKRIVTKYFWKTIASAIGVLFLVFHQEIYVKIGLINKPKEEKPIYKTDKQKNTQNITTQNKMKNKHD